MFAEKINNLQEPTHVIILPEMFSTGFSMKPELLAEKNGWAYCKMDEKNFTPEENNSYRKYYRGRRRTIL